MNYGERQRIIALEPYAAAVYSILFSERMEIKDVRILRREAYEKNAMIDDILIESIKTINKGIIWSKSSPPQGRNIVFVSRTKVVIPDR